MLYIGENTGAVNVTADGEPLAVTTEAYSGGTGWIYLVDIRKISTVDGKEPVTPILTKLIDEQDADDNMALFYNGKNELALSNDKDSAQRAIKGAPYKKNDQSREPDSTNGTYINGKNITRVIALNQQDEISFGPETKYTVRWSTRYI